MPIGVDTLVVEELNSHELGYGLITLNQSGATASRFFRVNRNVDADIINADGIPRPGDTHPRASELVCISTTPQIPKGVWTVVECQYASLGIAPTELIAEDGDSYHELIGNQTNVTIVEDTHGNPLPASPGGGVTEGSIQATEHELHITAIRSTNTPMLLWVRTPLHERINSNAVQIPPYFGLPGTEFVANPGELLAKSISVQKLEGRNGLLKIQYRLGFAKDHKGRFSKLDKDLRPIPGAPPEVRDLYQEAAFPPPGVLW